MHTLLDRDVSSRPEGTAIIARELGKYQIDIAILSKARLAEEGSIVEPKGGYTFFWRGKAKDEDRIHGVGLAIKTSLCRQLPDLPTPMSQRLMKLRFPLNPSRHVSHQRIPPPPPAPTSPHPYQQRRGKERFLGGAQRSCEGCPPKRQAHPAGRLQCESGYRLQQLERRTRTSAHGTGKLNSSGLSY